MDAVFTTKELAARWKCHENTIRQMEEEGRLHRLSIPGVRFSADEVTQLECLGRDAQGLTAWERRKMELEIKDLKRQVKTLQERLTRVMVIAQGGGIS